MRGGPRPEDFETNPSTPITGQPTPTYPAGARKKGVGVRTWLVLCSRGQAQTTEVGKHAIMRRTGLPARDLRILDPLLSYPSTVLGRERAIVINLEHIKAIITAQEVLLLNSKDPSVAPFIDELQRRILCHYHATKPKEEENYEGENRTSMDQVQGTPRLFGDEAKKDAKQSLENQDGSKVLPFEFVALEACLEAASSSLESEAVRLELEAHPALDKLTSKISTLNLERVRQIKSRLVAITGRVQKVRDELEHLLDDDEDMAEMYLTEKLAQKLENSSASSMNESDTVEVDLPEEEEEDDRHAPDFLNLLPWTVLIQSNRDESYLRSNDDAHDLLMSAHSALSRNSRGTRTSSTRSAMTNKFDVEELEMLLEAYFVQIDGTLNKLSTLREYVDDTEDYINIMLDDKQNHLLQMGVMLTTATLVMSAFIAVAGVFGMNINIELFNDNKAGPMRFAWTVIGGALNDIGEERNMSRRESRDSEPKRDRFRFDRESSPKRSRRDEAEGVLLSKKDFDVSTETDKKPRQSLRDAAPLEPDSQGLRKDGEKKHPETTTKQAPHHSEGLRSRPYHQHDDRRITGRDDRRPTSERGSWRGSRDQSNRRAGVDRRDQDKSTWRHDRFHESDDPKGPLSRKRPAFREKKIPEESRNDTDRTRTENAKDTNLNSHRQNERNWRSNNERPAIGRDSVWNRDDGSRQSYRTDREGFNRNGRSGFHGSWTKAEKKWDHDLYEEANKSPAKANEEEQIAKVEALLSS
ncbi:hypothetical protein Bca4012_084679 [Brassica carinata]